MTLASASMLVQYLMPIAPWLTSMPSPSTIVQLRASASLMKCVRGGLGITSATTMPGLSDSMSTFCLYGSLAFRDPINILFFGAELRHFLTTAGTPCREPVPELPQQFY